MSKFDKFAGLIAANKIEQALEHFRNAENEIVKEFRRIASEEDSDEYWRLEHTVYGELINSRLERGDKSAIPVISKLISESVMLNELDGNGWTPIAILAHGGHYELVKQAIDRGVDVNYGKCPALTAAVFSRSLPDQWKEVVEYLLDNGADPNGGDGALPPLFPTIGNNHRDAIHLLVSCGADVNKIHDIGEWGDFSGTSLHWAIRSAYGDHTDVETTSILLELGADPTIKNKRGDTPVDFAYYKEYQDYDQVKPVIKVLSSKEEWRNASWWLNQKPYPKNNPPRKTKISDSNYIEKIWEGIEFRIGDKIEVIRRGGRLDPSLSNSPGSHIHAREVIALPGLTGTVVSFSPGGGGSWKYFKAVVDFDPGEWEEADNYGKTVKLPKCRDFIFPELVRITETAESLGNHNARKILPRIIVLNISIWLIFFFISIFDDGDDKSTKGVQYTNIPVQAGRQVQRQTERKRNEPSNRVLRDIESNSSRTVTSTEQSPVRITPPEILLAEVTIRSNVHGDVVYIDGERKGSTRLDLKLLPGDYHIRVEKKPEYQPYEAILTFSAGEQRTVRAKLLRSKKVTARPTSKVIKKTTSRSSSWTERYIDNYGCLREKNGKVVPGFKEDCY